MLSTNLTPVQPARSKAKVFFVLSLLMLVVPVLCYQGTLMAGESKELAIWLAVGGFVPVFTVLLCLVIFVKMNSLLDGQKN